MESATILVIDDEPVSRQSIEALLNSENYHLHFAQNGLDGIALALSAQPDVILLDVMMPVLDGFEVCRRMRQLPELAEVPILMTTTLDDRTSRLMGLNAGADDFLSKPLDRLELRTRLRTLTRLDRYRKLHQERQNLQKAHLALQSAYEQTIEGWARALDLRDKETEGHSRRVTQMTLRLAQAAAIPNDQLIHIQRGALLHDIGKVGVPDYILHKPGALNADEWAIMRLHPVYAFQILEPITYLQPALDIPRYHHERWDGKGYPEHLQGTQIPLHARLFSIVDVWDALRSDRPYRKAWSQDRTLKHIHSLKHSAFDPDMVELFIELRPWSNLPAECTFEKNSNKLPSN